MTVFASHSRALSGFVAALFSLLSANAEEAPRLLLRVDTIPLRTGAFSPFASLQSALEQRLKACGKTQIASGLRAERMDGLFGPESALAVRTAHECGLPLEASAGLTEDLWRALVPDLAVPGLQDRIDVMILTFEATDFGRPPEWNLCQDAFEPRGGGQAPLCINHSDPCSFLTWGPRGATAGQGREIQWILMRVLRENPALLAAAFGDEFEHLRRFLTLAAPPPEDCDGSTPLEHFMCALWLDVPRRDVWTRALTQLGQDATVRQAFGDIYALEQFDGYKLRAYRELWQRLDLRPSEIDYAFFLDRATQIGAPPEEAAPRMQVCMQNQKNAAHRNAAARRCLSQLHPHPTLPIDRLGRDVAFFKESYAAGSLSGIELTRWQHHIPILAQANFGLSDDREVPLDAVLPQPAAIEDPEFAGTGLTAAERNCPATILSPVRAKPVQSQPAPAR